MLDGWYTRHLDKEGIQLSEYKDTVLVTLIVFNRNGTFKGNYRPDMHTPWKSYQKQEEMDKIWDLHFVNARDFEKFVHDKPIIVYNGK